jgi:hypothetical protein
MMYPCLAKAPPQPLPTRGRGLLDAAARHNRNLSTPATDAFLHQTVPRLGPSPRGEGSCSTTPKLSTKPATQEPASHP